MRLRLAALTAVVAIAAASLSLPGHARAAQRPCSSYPTPGTLAAAGTRLPGWLTREYPVLGGPQRPVDQINPAQISSSLTASGLVMSGTRFLGDAAFGGRVYVVPAVHLLAFKLAPPRCLPASERSLEQELAPQLKSEYKHWALCVIVLHTNSGSPSCGAANADPEALLYTSGTPGFGLVPRGVSDVTISYLAAPPRTLAVKHNFFLINDPRQAAPPCSVQWQDDTGNVVKTLLGCDYVQLLQPQLYDYRGYVQTTLQTLQTQVTALISAIKSGSLATAESDWLTAHETWLDIGQDDGAYSAYGNLGGSLDGLATGPAGGGLEGGTSNPDFTGFHRVEYDLWTLGSLSDAATDAETLQSILNEIVAMPLTKAFPDTTNGIANWILRPHEIIEDAIRDTLTGDDDYGSGTGIASLVADSTADREFLSVLAPVLDPLAPKLVRTAQGELASLDAACTATEVDGKWVAVDQLPTNERELIDADAGQAAETLSRIPDLLTSIGHAAPTD